MSTPEETRPVVTLDFSNAKEEYEDEEVDLGHAIPEWIKKGNVVLPNNS